MVPSSCVDVGSELPVRKAFSFLKQNTQYQILGRVMALAKELNCIPVVEWMYSELVLTLPATPHAEILAAYMNDQERMYAGLRNQTSGTGATGTLWSSELAARIETKSSEEFCWCLTEDFQKNQTFMQETYFQWYHRADYLVSRKSRDKKEFRQDFSMKSVLQGGQERKRRMQQRKIKEEAKEEKIKTGKESEWDTFVADVLPREIRETLDRESDGMDDVRFARQGAAVGNWRKR